MYIVYCILYISNVYCILHTMYILCIYYVYYIYCVYYVCILCICKDICCVVRFFHWWRWSPRFYICRIDSRKLDRNDPELLPTCVHPSGIRTLDLRTQSRNCRLETRIEIIRTVFKKKKNQNWKKNPGEIFSPSNLQPL
jgi:hypothetical protein